MVDALTATPPTSAPREMPPDATRGPDAARRAAEDFESVFLAQMLSAMTRGLGGESPLGDGVYGDMLAGEYAKLISRSGGIGIADAVLREILKMQEVG